MNKLGKTLLKIAVVVSTVPSYAPTASIAEDASWIEYAEQPNGDLFFYDASRVQTLDASRHVWNGIRYKTSLMGAFSFNSLVEIDCVNRTVKTLQSTFFSDSNWEQAAMATDMSVSESQLIEAGSPMERLADVVCDE